MEKKQPSGYFSPKTRRACKDAGLICRSPKAQLRGTLSVFYRFIVFHVGPRRPSGFLAAHENDHLPLLPSGSDGVHEFPLRKTQPPPRSDLENKKTRPITAAGLFPTFTVCIWRRERDSNPRYSFPYTRFPGVLLQPLGHLSVLPNNFPFSCY